METLGYASGFAVFRWLRSRRGDVLAGPERWTLLAAAAIGALLGSRLLGIAEQWPTVLNAWKSRALLEVLFAPGGKTIAGGLLGGWMGVFIIKRLKKMEQRAGDIFALPLCVGIAVGRAGCLLAGLSDDTYGVPTTLPWAVDFGDGIGRHPVQAYEILFLAFLAFVVTRRVTLADGTRFRIFLGSYLLWRVVIDFWKPQPLLAGMNLIQWCCLTGAIVLSMNFIFGGKQSHERAAG